MPAEAIESTAEGRESGVSTPAPTTAAPPETSSAAANDAGKAETFAQAEAATDVRDRAAFDALTEGKSPTEARTIAKSSATPKAAKTRGGGEPVATSEVTDANAADLSPRGSAAPLKDYGETIEEGTYHTLNRVGMLPTAAEWAILPSHARGQIVSAAKAVIKAKNAGFQASKQTNGDAGQGAPGQTGDETLDEETPAGGQPQGLGKHPPAGQGEAGESDPDEEAYLQQLVDYYGGDDTVVTPLKGLLQAQNKRHTAALAQKDAAMQMLLGEVAAMQAHTAFESLKKDIPELADAKTQNDVIRLAGSIYRDERAGNSLFTFGQAVRQAAFAKFQPNLSQQAQQRLLNERAEVVTGTNERVGGVANQARGMTADERERAIYDALYAGKSVDEAKAAGR